MREVLLLRPFRETDPERFRDLPDCRCRWTAAPAPEQLAAAEVIFGEPTREMLLAAPRLKWIQSPNAGVDRFLPNVDLIKERGIGVSNMSGAFGESISEHVLADVLALYKHLHLFRDHQRAHLWKDEGAQYSPSGKDLLILGTGNIGSWVAKRFAPFGCRITGFRRSSGEVPEHFDRVVGREELDEALKEADIVVGALPGTEKTRKLLDRERLALLKPSAVLVNVGRGSLIDCEALAELLAAGKLYGAALDVTDPEPLPPGHPLWDCENAIITPHASGGSFGHLQSTEDELYRICHENLARYLAGETPLNLVDWETGYRKYENRR